MQNMQWKMLQDPAASSCNQGGKHATNDLKKGVQFKNLFLYKLAIDCSPALYCSAGLQSTTKN